MALREPNLPETECYSVQLCKDDLGLGITVAGYVCEKGRNLCVSFKLIFIDPKHSREIAKHCSMDVLNDKLLQDINVAGRRLGPLKLDAEKNGS